MSFPAREPTEKVTIRLPKSLYREVRVLLADPRTGRIKYDALNAVFKSTLRRWCDEQKVSEIADIETCI